MGIIYLIPAAALWVVYAVLWIIGAPWWIDYPVYGLSCAATAVGWIITIVTSGSRF